MQIFDLPITSIITDYKNLMIQTSSKNFFRAYRQIDSQKMIQENFKLREN